MYVNGRRKPSNTLRISKAVKVCLGIVICSLLLGMTNSGSNGTSSIDDGTYAEAADHVEPVMTVGTEPSTVETDIVNEIETVVSQEDVEDNPGAVSETVTPTTPISNQTVQSSASCDLNYSDCVPIASDVDCAGGSGDGPAYVAGPIRVIGVDIYKLDRDGDGIACQ